MELFEKDTPPNNKKEVDETLAKRLERRASRRLISQNEDQKVNARLGLSFLGAIG